MNYVKVPFEILLTIHIVSKSLKILYLKLVGRVQYQLRKNKLTSLLNQEIKIVFNKIL